MPPTDTNFRSPDNIVIGIYAKNNSFGRLNCNGANISTINRDCATAGWVNVFTRIADPLLRGLTANLIDNGPATRSFSVQPGQIGNNIIINTTINNTGGGDAPEYNVSFYASSDANIDTGDNLLGTVTVTNHRRFSSRDITLNRPLTIPPGSYFIGWLIDPITDPVTATYGIVGEYHELEADFAAANPGVDSRDYYNPVITDTMLIINPSTPPPPPPPPPSSPVGQLQFSMVMTTVDEAAGTADIMVTRSGGSNGAVSIEVSSSDGSATAGTDYNALNTTLNWADGDTADKTATITILEDSLNEPNETILFSLSNPGGDAELGTDNSATLTIVDNDEPPLMSSENDGVPDAVEDAAPNNGDGNHDGILDSQQAQVASLPSPVSDDYVTIAVLFSDSDCPIENAKLSAPDSLARRYRLPR